VILSRDFAAGIGLTLGDEVTVIAPRTRLTPFGPVPVSRQYRITRLLPASRDERPNDILLPFAEAADLFGTAGLPTSIELYADSLDGIEASKKAFEERFPALQVKTWEDINRPLFLALRLEKVVMFATISLIIFVAALNLISSLSMLIVEKRPQVGVLRTLGASESSILRIFLGVGLLIGIFGTIGGNIIGLGVAWAANRYELVPLPGDVYYVSHIPFMIDAADVIGVNIIALVLSVLATWYPARIASRLDPVVAIRDE
jgi:lipoprotein-releasing system permease protein